MKELITAPAIDKNKSFVIIVDQSDEINQSLKLKD